MSIDIAYLKKFKPFYFGLGFIQLKMNQHERLHFYHPEILPIVDEEEIHNHRYDFTSEIIKGKLYQDIFFPIKVDDPRSTHGVYNVSCKPEDSGKPSELIYNCTPILVGSFSTREGNQYTMTKNAFHRVKIKEPTITYLKRESPQVEFAQIIKPIGMPDVCPFSKKLTDDEIWDVISGVMGSEKIMVSPVVEDANGQ